MDITAEKLAYWYFRLNGFLTIENFLVHSDTGSDQRTDVDILGLRFPDRKELLKGETYMLDDDLMTRFKGEPITMPYLILGEVKSTRCELNDSWLNASKENLQRMLRSVGLFSPTQIDGFAGELYQHGYIENAFALASIVCVGSEKNEEISKNKPDIPQILLDDMKRFIFHRFREYRRQKTSNGQWDQIGIDLFHFAESKSEHEFITEIRIIGRI